MRGFRQQDRDGPLPRFATGCSVRSPTGLVVPLLGQSKFSAFVLDRFVGPLCGVVALPLGYRAINGASTLITGGTIKRSTTSSPERVNPSRKNHAVLSRLLSPKLSFESDNIPQTLINAC
jgi:hypothetical protein